jgi:hypothetical protein
VLVIDHEESGRLLSQRLSAKLIAIKNVAIFAPR